MFGTVRSTVERHPIVVFLVVTFGYSFGVDLVGYSVLGESPSQLFLLPRAWGPLVGAVAVTWALGDSVRELLGQVTRWRVSPGWYLLAPLIPILYGEADVLAYVVAGVPVELTDASPLSFLTNFLITLLVAGGIEEFGWRGFAQPRLQENHSAGLVAIGIGLVWVAWHLPFFVLFEYEVFELGGFHWYLLESVAFSVILAWLYNQTSGSLLIVMLCHGTHNLSGVIEPAAEPTGVTARLADVAPDIASVLIVVGLFVAFGHDSLTRSSLPPNVLGRPGSN